MATNHAHPRYDHASDVSPKLAGPFAAVELYNCGDSRPVDVVWLTGKAFLSCYWLGSNAALQVLWSVFLGSVYQF